MEEDLGEIIKATVYDGSAVSYIYNVLKRAIFTGALEGTTRLRQEEIARRFGVSSIPVREAFKQLQAEGLVEIVPRRGAFVTELTTPEIQEIYEIRQLLEVGALRFSFNSISNSEINSAKDCIDQMESTEDELQWCELNEKFHDLLYCSSGKKMIVDLLKNLRNRVNRYVVAYLRAMRTESEHEHRRIYEALISRDIDLASRELEQHLKNAMDAIVASKEGAVKPLR
ncbi:MAG: GntR family transcriptional regulator [Synergistales bacterium]|nr:GntR family transcriptional regulator [Synergistales bacterium]